LCFWLGAAACALAAVAGAQEPAKPDGGKLQGLLKAGEFAQLDAEMSAYQQAYRAGAINDEAASQAFIALVDSDPDLRGTYEGWVAALPQSYVAHLARGYYLMKLGYLARGSSYARETPKARMDDMHAHFKLAMQDLERSLMLDPKPTLSYGTMIAMANGVGAHDAAAKYLDSAIALDARVFTARAAYFSALRPQWGGSLEQMEQTLESWKASLEEKQYLRLRDTLLASQWRAKLAPLAALVEARRYQEAVAGYSKVLEQTPVLRAYAMRGYSYAELGQLDKAIEDYSRVLEIDPDGGCCPNTRANRARAYLKTGKKELALADLLYAAPRDDAWSARELAMIYAFGRHGFKRDYVVAKRWCERAAKQGDPMAMYCLGGIHHAGLGTAKDLPLAAYWFASAGVRGVADAQTDIGVMYWGGQGVPEDRARAVQWWRLAAAQGNERAASKLREHGYWWSYLRYGVLRGEY
jgi:TPR repeat protein